MFEKEHSATLSTNKSRAVTGAVILFYFLFNSFISHVGFFVHLHIII